MLDPLASISRLGYTGTIPYSIRLLRFISRLCAQLSECLPSDPEGNPSSFIFKHKRTNLLFLLVKQESQACPCIVSPVTFLVSTCRAVIYTQKRLNGAGIGTCFFFFPPQGLIDAKSDRTKTIPGPRSRSVWCCQGQSGALLTPVHALTTRPGENWRTSPSTEVKFKFPLEK